jgi:hypothetical protein
MSTTINAARTCARLSRRERQRLARTDAFSRRTAARPPAAPVITFERAELEVIERLVQSGRTAVSSAVLAVAGIGTGEARRCAMLAEVGWVACAAQARGAISRRRGGQIARHVETRLASEERLAAAA